MVDITDLEKIRKLIVVSMFTDDDLMEMFALKGGNALELVYQMNARASTDIDFSMRKEFSEIGLQNEQEIQVRLEHALNETFNLEGITVYDVRLISKPKKDNELIPFFAGYELKFKLIESDKYEEHKGSRHHLDKYAGINSSSKKVFSIDLGRHEYCGDLEYHNMNNYLVTIYTPTLILLEKFRAICQQMPEYQEGLNKTVISIKPRPRDFYDIYSIMKYFEDEGIPIELNDIKNVNHLKESFKAKEVPISLLKKVHETRDFHKQEESKLRDSVYQSAGFQGFDFYFDYVCGLIVENGLDRLA